MKLDLNLGGTTVPPEPEPPVELAPDLSGARKDEDDTKNS